MELSRRNENAFKNIAMNKHPYVVLILLAFGNLLCAQPEATSAFTEVNNLLYLDADEVEVDSLQRLNLIVPKGVDNPPLLIWIGGGAWSYVDRHVEMDLARKMAQKGIAFASIGHRLSSAVWRFPERTEGVQHPAHVEDVAKACKWLFDHAKEYGYDQANFFIGGFSSGAHLAALLTLDDQYLKAVGLSVDNFKGVIPMSGTYDIIDYHSAFANSENENSRRLTKQHVEAVFGDSEEDFIKASPVTFLNNLKLPMLIFSDMGLYNYTNLFEQKIRNETEFTDFQVINVHKLNHAELWRDISLAEKSIYREMITYFIFETI